MISTITDKYLLLFCLTANTTHIILVYMKLAKYLHIEMTNGICVSILVFSAIFFQTANGAKILALFSTPSKSHVIVHTSLMVELAERGHNVRNCLSHTQFTLYSNYHLIR